jgi:hypothetical protein
MATRKLDPSGWKEYFDDFSRRLPVTLVEIEVASPSMGDQILSEWNPLEGISYDPKGKALLIGIYEGTDHFDHRVYGPREIYIEEEDQGISSIGVVDDGGNTQIIRFRKRLRLPSDRRPAEAESVVEQR